MVAPALANTPASASQQATQLSLRAARLLSAKTQDSKSNAQREKQGIFYL